MPRGCVNRIRLWPLKRDDHSGVLIGSAGTRLSNWPAHMLANYVSARIDRWTAHGERSIARVQGQVVGSCYNYFYFIMPLVTEDNKDLGMNNYILKKSIFRHWCRSVCPRQRIPSFFRDGVRCWSRGWVVLIKPLISCTSCPNDSAAYAA